MRLVKGLRNGAAILAGSAALGAAQVPGAPVLQNAFSNAGLTFAADFGSGSGQSFYGAAAGWGLGGLGDGARGVARFQISAAAGASRSNDATRGAYGARVAGTLWHSSGGNFGLGAFAGMGGAPRTRSADVVTNPALLIVPVGASVAYARPLGRSRAISAYASPFYRWVRADGDSVETAGSIRVSLGVDFAISQSFGATVGAELGQGSSDGAGAGGRGGSGAFGVALSFVPGRR